MMLSLIGVFATQFVAFSLLATAQHQHRRAMSLGSPDPAARRRARIAAAALLMLALVLALWRDGPGLGSLLWITMLSAAACSVTIILTIRPRWLAIFA